MPRLSVREAMEQFAEQDGPEGPVEISPGDLRPLTEDEKDEQVTVPAADARDSMRAGQVRQQQEGLADARRNLDADARFEQATRAKSQANDHFARNKPRVAIVGYLAGIWFLKRGDPPCPQLIASEDASLDGVADALGAGSGADVVGGIDGVAALRIALHLNLAVAALKLSEWVIATRACEFVLGVKASNEKALFRLAKAQEGASEPRAATATVSKLLRVAPSNVEARKLLETLQAKQAREKKMFAGVFGRAQAEGRDLYNQAEEEHKAAEKAVEREASKPPVQMTTSAQLRSMSDGERQAWLDEVNAGCEA